MITIILWFLNIRHSGTLFLVCGSSPQLNKCSFSSYPLKAKYVEPMGKGKGYNCWSSCILPSYRMVEKELRKLSQWLWKGFLKRYDGGGENEITSKQIFEVEVFFSSQNIEFRLFRTLGVLMIFEEKITSSKTSFKMASIYWRWTHILDWCYARKHG
jgi:hypothetical protein